MKKHGLLKVVLCTLLVVVILTWVLPTSYFDSYGAIVENAERAQMGLFDLPGYIPILLVNFCDIALYLLAIGGFYGVLYQIPAYRKLLDKIVKAFKHVEWLFLTVVIVLFALLSSMAGMYAALLFLFPFVISVILLMGYDKVTAALTTLGSVLVGLAGTVFSSSSIEGIESVFTYLQLDQQAGNSVVLKLIILAIGVALLIFNVLRRAKKHRDNKEENYGILVPKAEEKKAKSSIWPLVVIMDLVLLVAALSMISWSTVFNVNLFNDIVNKVNKFEILGFPIFSKILGSGLAAFGTWGLQQLNIVILLGSMVIAFIYGFKINEYFDSFIKGLRHAVKPAFYALIVYLVLIIVNSHPIVMTIVNPILKLTDGLNVATMAVIGFVTSIFDTNMYYEASNVLVLVSNYISDTNTYPLIAVIFQAMRGVALLIAPTSAILLATLSYLKVSYGKWLRAVIALFVELLVAVLVVTTIAFMML